LLQFEAVTVDWCGGLSASSQTVSTREDLEPGEVPGGGVRKLLAKQVYSGTYDLLTQSTTSTHVLHIESVTIRQSPPAIVVVVVVGDSVRGLEARDAREGV
jgi:hypothetical protein